MTLLIHPGESRRVTFVEGTFRSHLVHWIHASDNKWSAEVCAGTDCGRCLDGMRVQQRYTAGVVYDTEQRVLELPYGAWVQIIHRMKKMGPKQFFQTELEISKFPSGGGMTWEVEVV